MTNRKPIYFNAPQMEVMYTGAHTTVIAGGRRLGKTHGIIAPFVLRNIQRMPGSVGAMVVSTYKRGLTNTIPGTLQALEQWGYKRDVHYYIGKKPPKKACFPKPIIEPANYEHVISFYTGSIVHIISQDMPGTSNSLTLDWLDVDEAKFIDFEKLKNETLPANGGIKSHFGNKSYHHSIMIVSDMPTTKAGSWFLNYSEKCDEELIQLIQGLVYKIWEIKNRIRTEIGKGQTVPDYLRNQLRTMYGQLAKLRRKAVLYREYSSILNMEILGEEYINQMKRDLPPLTFQTSILCRRIGILKNGFYSNMRNNHKYNASDIAYLQNLDYQFDKIADDCSLHDADVDPNAPICIGMDYNSNINWMVCGQPNGNRLNIIKSFYVKYERKLKELVQDFCKYYRHHKRKEIVFYYDTTALSSNYAVNDEDFRYVIIEEFQKNGWFVNDVFIGNPMKHMEKYLLINRMFAGQGRLTPYFNEQNNEDLLISIQTAGVYNGKKDKRGEKLAETEEDKLENRTDGSDAFDTLCIGCERFPQDNFYFNVAGV